MKNFTCVQDIGPLDAALQEAFEIKKDRFKYVELGRNKTLMMIFFNSSLRTRLSTQKAALNLGMNVIVLDINQGAWKLETERGVIMDGDKPEHLLEAIPVMGCYCDVIGVRSFARFENRDYDYEEVILNQFIKYSGRPVLTLPSGGIGFELLYVGAEAQALANALNGGKPSILILRCVINALVRT